MKIFTGGAKGFASVLKKARQDAGMSQTELAEKAGIHVGSYNPWELGKREPSLLKFQPVIAALGEHARPLLKEIGYAP